MPIRYILAGLMAVLLALGITACGGDDDGESGGGGEDVSVVFSAYSREPAFIQASEKGLNETAEEKGWQFESVFANNDPAAQVGQIENAITTQPDVIITWANDVEAVIPALEQARESDIATVTMGQDVADPEARDFYVGPDYVELGRHKAEQLVELLNGEGRIGMIRGIRGADFTEKQGAGADEVFSSESGIEVVDDQYAGAYSSDNGLETAENMLTANPDLNGIYIDNDDIAVGVIQALESRNLVEQVELVSTDGTPEGLDAVRAGELEFTTALCGVEDGAIAIEAIEDLIVNGEDVPDRVQTSLIDVTPDTIQDKEDELSGCN